MKVVIDKNHTRVWGDEKYLVVSVSVTVEEQERLNLPGSGFPFWYEVKSIHFDNTGIHFGGMLYYDLTFINIKNIDSVYGINRGQYLNVGEDIKNA